VLTESSPENREQGGRRVFLVGVAAQPNRAIVGIRPVGEFHYRGEIGGGGLQNLGVGVRPPENGVSVSQTVAEKI